MTVLPSSGIISLEDREQPDCELRNARHIWAVGGGKGGVGKSLVTANLSICLALMGHKVVAVDLDLGGANLHTCLGVSIPQKTLSDYFRGAHGSFTDLLTPTLIDNLWLISGAQDDLGIANLRSGAKKQLLSDLGKLDVDYIIFDLGAGTHTNTLDFFLSAERKILVVTPEPTSIENTYRFLKAVLHRHLGAVKDFAGVTEIIDQVMNAKITDAVRTPMEMVHMFKETNPEMGQQIMEEISKLNPSLVLNQTRTQTDTVIGYSMQKVCKKYFGINLNYSGYLDYDAAVWQSVRSKKPLLMEFPNSKLVYNFEMIVNQLLRS